jgi:enamine deaminase RidA (YjgF/YER057c/UK114 family)
VRRNLVATQKVSSGGKYEEMIGYSRAVRAGNLIFVSGTGSVSPKRPPAGEDEAYVQAKEAIATISEALQKLGATLSDVVRTRVFVRADADWKKVSRAHKESFGDAKPASTWLVGIFLDPTIIVEIEADAIVPS